MIKANSTLEAYVGAGLQLGPYVSSIEEMSN